MISKEQSDLFHELRNYLILTSGEIVECKKANSNKDSWLIKLSHKNPDIENPYCMWTRPFVSGKIDMEKLLAELGRYKNHSNNFKWSWCAICDYAVIACDKCDNSSCNGGGCDECWYDFELASYLSRRGFHPPKDDLKVVGDREALKRLFTSK